MNEPFEQSRCPTEGAGSAPVSQRDLYELLGLAPFETNPRVISSKARELMREARKYQIGPQAARCQAQLDELAGATACLLDPARKYAYDDELRQRYGLPPIAVASTYVDPRPMAVTKTRRGSRTMFVGAIAVAAVAILGGIRLLAPASSRATAPGGESSRPTPRVAKTTPKKAADRADRNAAPLREAERTGARREPASAGARPRAPLPDDRRTEFTEVLAPIGGDDVRTTVTEGDIPVIVDPRPIAADVSKESAPLATPPVAGVGAPAGKVEEAPAGRLRPDAAAVARPARRPAEPDFELTSAEILRELKDLRLKRTPIGRVAADPRALSTDRVVQLVRYARREFEDDRRFQRQLDQEVTAIKRAYPQLRDLLSDKRGTGAASQ